jgi:hypothetical protein
LDHASKLWQMMNDLPQLQKLSYTDMEIDEWENKVLEILEEEYGQNSEYYQQFLKKVQFGFWHFGRADPRGSMSTPETYQKEYQKQLSLYRSLLLSFLKGC